MHGFMLRVIFDPNNVDSVLDACIQGNQSAQRELFKRYFGYSKSICQRYTNCSQDADEVLNEGFLKVFKNLDKYDRLQPFKAWLRTILVNTAISHYRKNRKYLDYQTGYDDFIDCSIDDDVIGDIAAQEIMEVIQQLKPIYKTVFLLNVVDGYSLKEIAVLLQINAATVRSHFSRARLQLQDLITVQYPHLRQRCK
ncbi:RNA polymerase sigma factor [Dyadobacter flavalbus]|uniref:RNA polymerase sigma factor n=1 Tax=Dyadobacter flavalbus TaxID=2579942 RepID=A0A5M8QVV1_9BACT|nr:RNA polymerase sigma factor [Dyadobacter flavalbus]KAA6438553.1 RNA polymerase sigma factor [Dyadobacter flavalbus]